jgi:membrane associated rhomboid family serine protease
MRYGSSFFVQLAAAVLLPAVVGLFFPQAFDLFWFAIELALYILPCVFFLALVYEWSKRDGSFTGVFLKYLRPVPGGFIYGSDLRNHGLPWVTMALVALNALFFFTLPERLVLRLICFPVVDPTPVMDFVSLFTSAFLHADLDHLMGNMIFLWAFAAAVEARIGGWRFLSAYIAGIALSKVFTVALVVAQAVALEKPEILANYHSLGASGVVSAVTGMFAVRCYFARLSLSIPMPFNPFMSFPLRVPGLLLIGIYFAMDVSGSLEQFADEHAGVNYWAHVGGFLGGCALAWAMGLHRAAGEEAVKVQAGRARELVAGQPEAARLFAEVLEKEPENLEALRYFLDLAKYDETRQGQYFARLVPVLLRNDFPQALTLVGEHWPRHLNALPGDALFRLGSHFFRNADLNKARLCLELAAEAEGPWQGKALLLLSDTYGGIGNPDRARKVLRQALEGGEDPLLRQEAEKRLGELEEKVPALQPSIRLSAL